ncbi:MAG: response regulator [Leptospiraceae bacterium]|nr:response regulator [Leptospiraceae bacterium]MDW8306973.1 adenylate/guanylate cyclase domain-containing protein [Leptospiraceae bacterium]
MQFSLYLHGFSEDEKTRWEKELLPNLQSHLAQYNFTYSELELNSLLIRPQGPVLVLYYLSSRRPQDRDFVSYLAQLLKIPVVIVHTEENLDEYALFDLGIEDFLNLSQFNYDPETLKTQLLKILVRHHSREKVSEKEKLEQEGIFLREPKILVVEDDEVLSEGIRRILEEKNYQVNWANSLAGGIMEYTTFRPDLILLDYQLPDGEARDFIEHIQSEAQEVPIVVLTARPYGSWWNEIFYEVEDIINKPVNLHELEIRVRRLLQTHIKLRRCQNELTKLEKFTRSIEPFLPPDIQKRMQSGEITTKTGGHTQIATVAFFDLRNSTALGNRTEAGRFAEILNSILHDVMDLAVSHRGSVNKLLGDGLLLTFGAPDPRYGDAEDAVSFALGVKDHFLMLNSVDAFSLGEAIKFGIGIASGLVFAGNIGSIHRMEFTVMGDVVNTAARLETLNKKLNTQIVIDEATYQQITPEKQGLFQSHRIEIRGKGSYVVWALRA